MRRSNGAILALVLFWGACGETEPVEGPNGGETGEPDEQVAASDLPSSLDGEQMWAHLEALQQIADSNDGHRSLGSSGYEASVDYVVSQLESYGYDVVKDAFEVTDFVVNSQPVVALNSPSGVVFSGSDLEVMTYSASGDVTASVSFVDVLMPPPLQTNSSSSGCEASDFADFPTGHIAVIQRGTCTFQDKVNNAIAAGATGVILFNEGQPGRTDAVEGTLDSSVNNPLPVVGASYDVAEAILSDLNAYGTLEVQLTVDAAVTSIPSTNVIADTASGNTDRVVLVGAHLDSVPTGPGINDNGTGVALVLELARQVALLKLEPENQLRFALWGGEEFGLLGSIDYVLTGSESGELSKVMANLNYDMIGSPNPARFIYDGDGSSSGSAGPVGSDLIEYLHEEWFEGLGLSYLPTPFDGRSDYGAFVYFGIPAGGLFTGAEGIMSDTVAQEFAGTPSKAYDPCYHEACDTVENVNRPVFEEMAAAAAYAMVETAMLPSGFERRHSPAEVKSLFGVVPDPLTGCRRHLHEPLVK